VPNSWNKQISQNSSDDVLQYMSNFGFDWTDEGFSNAIQSAIAEWGNMTYDQ